MLRPWVALDERQKQSQGLKRKTGSCNFEGNVYSESRLRSTQRLLPHREMESFQEHLVISVNSNPDVDYYPSEIYNINYNATWNDKDRKSSFCSPSIAHHRAEN